MNLTVWAEEYLGRRLDPHEAEIVRRLEASGLEIEKAIPILEAALGKVQQAADDELPVARYEAVGAGEVVPID